MDPACIRLDDWLYWVAKLNQYDINNKQISNQVYTWQYNIIINQDYLISYEEFKIFVDIVDDFIRNEYFSKTIKNKKLKEIFHEIFIWYDMYRLNLKRKS